MCFSAGWLVWEVSECCDGQPIVVCCFAFSCTMPSSWPAGVRSFWMLWWWTTHCCVLFCFQLHNAKQLAYWCEKFLSVVVIDNPLLCVSAAQCQATGLLVWKVSEYCSDGQPIAVCFSCTMPSSWPTGVKSFWVPITWRPHSNTSSCFGRCQKSARMPLKKRAGPQCGKHYQ